MAPNLAVSTHELTENVIRSKLQDNRRPTGEHTASIACYSRVRYAVTVTTSSFTDQQKLHRMVPADPKLSTPYKKCFTRQARHRSFNTSQIHSHFPSRRE
ncbi:hypothetical protein ACMFMG_012024 [Clarireedia jacksonii]